MLTGTLGHLNRQASIFIPNLVYLKMDLAQASFVLINKLHQIFWQ